MDLIDQVIAVLDDLAAAAPPEARRERDFIVKVRALYRGDAGMDVRRWSTTLDEDERDVLAGTMLNPFVIVPLLALQPAPRASVLAEARSLGAALSRALDFLEDGRASGAGANALALMRTEEVEILITALQMSAARAASVADSGTDEDEAVVASAVEALGPVRGAELMAAVLGLRGAAYDAGFEDGTNESGEDDDPFVDDDDDTYVPIDAEDAPPAPMSRQERRAQAARDRRARRKR